MANKLSKVMKLHKNWVTLQKTNPEKYNETINRIEAESSIKKNRKQKARDLDKQNRENARNRIKNVKDALEAVGISAEKCGRTIGYAFNQLAKVWATLEEEQKKEVSTKISGKLNASEFEVYLDNLSIK